jgi:hypothetical protein
MSPTGSLQTLVLIGVVSFLLMATKFDVRMASADLQGGAVVLLAGMVMSTSDLWLKSIIEPLAGERARTRSMAS